MKTVVVCVIVCFVVIFVANNLTELNRIYQFQSNLDRSTIDAHRNAPSL